jgi:uncharacterized membrane-anchored protein YjiN (DUF445 family)
MSAIATGLLVLMAGVFGLASWLEHRHPAWGFVKAFAEAAMVGGLADWFAVTALFRHPLGLPIPHTAIIPRNKDRIGDSLALFLRENFLVPAVVARRMRGFDIAGAAGRLLANPPVRGRMREGASRLGADLLESLDPQRLGGMVKQTIAARLRALEVAPLLGQALAAAMTDNRHLPLLDAGIGWAGRTLAANDHLIRQMIHVRAGAVMRWTGLDEKLSNAIIDGLQKILTEMGEDPLHPMRIRAEEGLARLALDLQTKETVRARVEAIKNEIVDNPAVSHWLDGLWESARAAMLRAVRDPETALAGKLGEALRQLGNTLQHDPRLSAAINKFARRSLVGMVASYGDGIVRLVSDTVRGWNALTITARLEAAVGRDLQYIRVNGTIVGGLVGLVIHGIETATRQPY